MKVFLRSQFGTLNLHFQYRLYGICCLEYVALTILCVDVRRFLNYDIEWNVLVSSAKPGMYECNFGIPCHFTCKYKYVHLFIIRAQNN